MLFASVVSSVSTVFILSEWIEAPTVFADDCTCVLKVHVHVCVSTCVHAFFFTFLHPLFFFFYFTGPIRAAWCQRRKGKLLSNVSYGLT